MSDIGAAIAGGMTKTEAKTFLKKLGYTNKRINKY